MIFYFSGTGNSKWAAEQIATQLGEELTNIASEPEDKQYQFTSGDIVGIVFPVYAWNMPERIRNFVKRIDAGGAYTFAVCTCGGQACYTIRDLSKLLPLDSGYSVIMTSNYIIRGEMDSESQIKAKVDAAKEKIDQLICPDIKNRKRNFDVHMGSLPWLRSSILSSAFNKYARRTDPFSVDKDKCTGCGLCQIICPSKAISLTDGRPAWTKDKCDQCFGCINRCPVRTINYGKKTAGKDRYYFKE